MGEVLPMELPEMICLSEASNRTGLPYDLLRRLCKDNKLTYIKSGKKIYLNVNSLNNYLNKGDNN